MVTGDQFTALFASLSRGYTERYKAVFDVSQAAPDLGDTNAQLASRFSGFQNFYDNLAVARHFCDYSTQAANPGTTYQTFLGLCQAAGGGLYSSAEDYGWQRATDKDENGDPIMVRGRSQPGDIMGSWLFENLQNAQAACNATLFYNKQTGRYLRRVVIDKGYQAASDTGGSSDPWGPMIEQAHERAKTNEIQFYPSYSGFGMNVDITLVDYTGPGPYRLALAKLYCRQHAFTPRLNVDLTRWSLFGQRSNDLEFGQDLPDVPSDSYGLIEAVTGGGESAAYGTESPAAATVVYLDGTDWGSVIQDLVFVCEYDFTD